jgi:hypothetical protein
MDDGETAGATLVVDGDAGEGGEFGGEQRELALDGLEAGGGGAGEVFVPISGGGGEGEDEKKGG